jgi:hypothetical protein
LDQSRIRPIHIEKSYKHLLAEIDAVAMAVGLQEQCFCEDAAGRFYLHLLAPWTDAAEA